MGSPRQVLFIYGSLKRGLENHRLIADQQYLGQAVTDPVYRILHLGRYPGLIRDDSCGLAVQGELWAVTPDRLQQIDDFEQAEGLWRLEPVAIAGHEKAEAYFWIGSIPDGVQSCDEWPLPPKAR